MANLEEDELQEEPGQEDSAANGGKKERSGTSYPYFGLSKAIEIVEAIRKAGGNEASNTDVQGELGVAKTTDRLWAYGIPAAIQFGLIERVGRGTDGRLKLTDLAIGLALPGSEMERKTAKIAAFKRPEIYSKLLAKFAGHPVPSKDGLKNIMVREFKILESMAPIAADAFLDSLAAAELVTSANTIAPAVDGTPSEKPSAPPLPSSKIPEGMKSIEVPREFIIYKCKISKSRVIELPLPPEFTKADADRLHKFLLTQVDDNDSIQQ
jgi:hypothetical protein